MSKISAVKNYGYDKLEKLYKQRMNKTGVDFIFKHACLSYDKKI